MIIPAQSFQKRYNPGSGTLTTGAYGECYIYGAGVTEQLIAPVILPTGAVITGVTFYYADNSANSNFQMQFSNAPLTTMTSSLIADLFQNTNNASSLTISSVSSGILSSVVTNGDYYYLVITPKNTTNTASGSWESGMSIRGVKITYTL
jgi:hypothetical protein